MKPWFSPRLFTLLASLAGLSLAAADDTFQLMSGLPPGQTPSASANGDSWCPVASAEGRFVLFASMANNLLTTTNNTALPAGLPPSLNLFLRDRAMGTTALVSVNVTGVAGGNGDSLPADLSPDGRYALFESSASDLVAGDTNNATDVFVRDAVANATIWVSVSTNGSAGNGASRSPVMTPDGRYVAFVSAANNLVPGDTNGIADVFVRDLQSGTTRLVSVGAKARTGTTANTAEVSDITPDGRFVVFYSTAANLVPGVPVGGDVYVRDLANDTTLWASAGARAAVQPTLRHTNIACYAPVISANGQFIAFEASPNTTTNFPGLVLRYDTETGLTELVQTNAAAAAAAFEDINNLEMTPDGRYIVFIANSTGLAATNTCVLVWDAQSGTTTNASVDISGKPTTNALYDWPAIDHAGRYVAFLSSATNLVTNSMSGEFHVYVRDLQSGTTMLANANTNGAGSPVLPSTAPRLSADGRTVVFESLKGDLVANDRNRSSDIFARDLVAGATELISARHSALVSATPNGLSTLSPASASSDGRFLAFSSEADNLIPDDTNQCRDVFIRDLATGNLTLVSANTNGFTGNGVSAEPSISPDGHYVAFTSSADNLVAGDNNNWQDVFLRDTQNGTTALVSVNTTGSGPGSRASFSPTIGTGGRYVVFQSEALNVAVGPTSGENLIVRDLQSATNYALTRSGVSASSMSPGSRFVVYVTSSKLYVWDLVANANIYTNSSLGILPGAVAEDGQTLAYWAGSGVLSLWMTDLAAKTNWIIATTTSASARPALRFDRGGKFLAFAAAPSSGGTRQVWLYDRQAGITRLVSQDYANPSVVGSGTSDSPDISADGRFVAFRSASTNLVPGYTSGIPALFLYDGQTGNNALLTPGQPGIQASENRSLLPIFSADGGTLFFQSWSSDLAGGDLNRSSDVFGLTFVTALILPASDPGQGPWLSWPWVTWKNYRVEYRDRLDAGDWQPLNGNSTNSDTRAWQQDPAPMGGSRFYRILSY